MSKQYLTAHVTEQAHKFDIFSLVVTESYIITVSGDPNVNVWETGSSKHSLVHQFADAHRLGAHHVVTSSSGELAATAGFAGEIIIWDLLHMHQVCKIIGFEGVWALALSSKGDRLISTTCDGKINIWDIAKPRDLLQQYTTKGSFGMCVDISPDDKLIASGHQNGGIYICNNVTARIHHSLQGLVKPIRQVKFSPGGKLLAACGDSANIVIFDVLSGEQVANLVGSSSWTFAISWNHTGEYLISGSFDGKVKVWSVATQSCVATHSESNSAIHDVSWMPKGEGFVSVGSSRSLRFYRETSSE
ncbi:WD domain-containing protein [Geopyxis carbonaria]|nr:WD domain-containing protein [Geopyxis carbonaria]